MSIIKDYSGWHFVNKDSEVALQPPAAGRLAELRMPILVLVGEYDLPDFLQVAEQIAKEAPAARKLIIPDVGHMANMEAPQQVNQAIAHFWDSLCVGPSGQ